jgi:hypothetical protein
MSIYPLDFYKGAPVTLDSNNQNIKDLLISAGYSPQDQFDLRANFSNTQIVVRRHENIGDSDHEEVLEVHQGRFNIVNGVFKDGSLDTIYVGWTQKAIHPLSIESTLLMHAPHNSLKSTSLARNMKLY